jgi:imidazolonepropionase
MEILEEGGGILSSTKMLEQSSDEEILNQTRARLARMAAHGTTTVEIKSGYGLSTEQEIRSLELIKKLKGEGPLDIRSTFMGAHAVPVEYRSSRKDFINMITNEMIPIVGRKKLADFCDVFCEKGVFDVKETELIFQSAIEHGLRLRLHSDEIESIGGTELGCASGAMSVDHLIAIKEAGLKALEGSRTVANLLPGTSFSLMKSYAPAREMVDRGIAVSISTDCNPGSCYTESMPMVITLACVGLRLSPEEAINAATFNGACSLGMQEEVGSIEMGKQADLLVLHCGDYREIPYHFGVNPVKMTMKKGQWLSFDGK